MLIKCKCGATMQVYRVEESYLDLKDTTNTQGSALVKYECPCCDTIKTVTVGFDIANIYRKK